MDSFELIVFWLSGFQSCRFIYHWYQSISQSWPPGRASWAKRVLRMLPLLALIIIVFTLKFLAAFDVVGDTIFILFYLFLGYTWIWFGMGILTRFFDLSWLDDALHLDNRAALPPVAGSYLGLSLIYAGANVGDGPGWWCVLVAGGLGLASWFGLILLLHLFNDVFERITVERDVDCGIRFGSYLLASAIILARASAGDWTSLGMTVYEFLAGWPVILLTAAAILVEMRSPTKWEARRGAPFHSGAVAIGAIYIMASMAVVFLLPPLP